MTKKKVRLPTWSALSLLMLTCRRADGRALALLLNVDDFTVLALEALEPERGATGIEAASAVFASHAHKVVGQRRTLAEAAVLAEDYASNWVAGDEGAAAALCDCGEIGAPAT